MRFALYQYKAGGSLWKMFTFVQIYFVSLFFLLFRKELERVAPEMNIVREIPFY